MLIQFSVTNYRSIKETQNLSMVATKDDSLQASHCIETGIPKLPQLVRAAVLYGANASGKSNLISALGFMRRMVETSAMGIREGQILNISPFRFDSKTLSEPTEFEVTFMENGIRYQYGFALNTQRVVREWLLVYVGNKAQRWFERNYDAEQNKDLWYFGSHFLGGKERGLWREFTRANALFLSTAVNMNNEQLRDIFTWFVDKLVVVGANELLDISHTMQSIKDDVDKLKIIELLQAADLGITDVQIRTQRIQVPLPIDLKNDGMPLASRNEVDVLRVTLSHQAPNNHSVTFELEEESYGTQKLFAYAGPLLDVLQHGKVLVCDELDASLHQKMIRFLIDLIHNADLNKNNAQLIFSTHNTALLDQEIFRRDQIWFVEKDQEQASHLYPLTDFKPRKDEALEKGYLRGRYGALPMFGDFDL